MRSLRGILFPVLVGGLAALLLAGCGEEAKKPQAPTPEVSFLTAALTAVDLTTELSGRTSALQVAEVRPQVGGIIKSRLFIEGAEVKQGEQLYQIDPAMYQAALDQAKASLLRAQANLTSSRLLAERYGRVVKANAVSKQQYDDAMSAYNQAKADVAAAKAAVDTASINLEYTKVFSPISGHVGISSVTPGALVTANQSQSLATVQQMDWMYVDVPQSSADILRMKRALLEGRLVPAPGGGAKVRLKLEDGVNYDLAGELLLSDVTVDQSTGMVTVRAKFENPLREVAPGKKDRLLFPGMFVRASLEEARDEKAILLPQQAVGRNAMGKATVLLLDEGGVVREQFVTVDRSVGNLWLVGSGVKQGDKIIVDGRVKVRAGVKANGVPYAPKNATAPAAVPAAPQAGK